MTMLKLIKRPLKLIAAASFMVALGYAVSTNSEFSGSSGKTSNANLSTLNGVSAQGEMSIAEVANGPARRYRC